MEENDVYQPQSNRALEPPPPPQEPQTNQQQIPSDTNNGYRLINGNNCLQQAFFTWVYQLLSKAQDEDLQVDSMPALPTHLRAEYEFQTFLQKKKELKQKGLLKILLNMFGRDILILVLLCVVVEVFYLSYPILIYYNIDFIKNHKDNTRYGILLFSLTILASFCYNLTFTNVKYRFNSLGVNLSTHLNLLIYHKSLNYSMIGNKNFSESDIIGYSQVDTDNMMYVGSRLAYFVFGIIEICAGFGLLYWFVGLAFIAGVVVLIIVSLLTFIVSSCSVELTEKALNSRDQRLSVTTELLNMIRFVKINAMEKFFYKRIQEQRQYQLMCFRKKGIIQIVLVLFYCVTAPLFLTATIVTYFIIHGQITSSEVFTTSMIAIIFEVTAQKVPKACSELLAVLRSIQRIDAFLQAEEIDTSNHLHSTKSNQRQLAVKIENGHFLIKQQQSDKQQPNKIPQSKQVTNGAVQLKIITNETNPQTLASDRRMVQVQKNQSKNESIILKNINLNIQKGKLYLIYGDIGSGKSVLLLSILNQINKKQQSRIQVNGKIAYVSQKPWILSGTVEQNIYFTFQKDENRLNEAIEYACLQDDVKQFKNGVKCEIGENGINLSGGQKFRVDLARSLYSQSDIYLYDDILSAVDIHVGTSLIDDTILGYLKGKTVIMATHAIRFANKADYIILIKNGQIVACDTYSQIDKISEFHEVQMKIMDRQRESKKSDPEQLKSIIHQIIVEQKIDIEITVSSERPSASLQDASAIQRLTLPEDQEKGSVATQIFKEYVRLNGGYICFLGSVMFCFLLYASLQAASSIFLSLWSQDSQNLTNLYIFIILTFSANLFIFLQAIILVFSGVKQGRQVHNNIVKGLLYASLTNFFNRVPMGRILNRLGKDLKNLDQSIAPNFSSFLVSFFRILAAVFIVIYTSTPYAIIPVVFVTLIFIKVRFFYLSAQNKLIRLQKVTNTPLVVSFTNGIRGAASIRCYKSSDQFLKTHIQLVNNYRRVLFNHFAAAGWFLMILVYVGFIVNMFSIGYCMFGPNTNPSYIGLLLSYILNMNDQVYSFVLQQADFQTQLISLQRLYHITQLPPEKRYVQYCKQWKEEEEQTPLLTSGSIDFKHASVRYRQNLPKVIKNLSCKIKSGEKIGIVGRTGSGKTTILNTIIGVSQLTQGQILIDGKSINEIPLKNLRREITVIDQQPVLFSSTFRQNLDVFNQYQDQQLIKIAKECSAYDIIQKRGGLQGKVNNDSLSAGQKQLICICRALLKNSKIVLIDQATANIDVVHDQIIQKVISQKFVDKTLLTIAHRLSTLKDYDKIMVLQAGQLLEFGTPKELLQMNGIYSQMANKYGASQLSNMFK